MSLERMPSAGENKEVKAQSSWVSRLCGKVRSAAMAVLMAVSPVAGTAVLASNSGCTFDPSGLAMPKDAETDVDADVDGDVDADVDCDTDGDAQVPDEVCNNGLDDDRDGLTDCADPDCDGQAGPNGGTCSTTEICGDNYDNNADGLVDCGDIATCEGFVDPRGFECTASGTRKETNCADNIDNDGDWATDCDDPDCAGTPACTPNPEICNNGIDDDGDGLADCADPNCVGQTGENGETCELTELTCNDGQDNDGDGDTDCDDSNCVGAPNCLVENCTDGVDNDGDGKIDCADEDCNNFSTGATVCAYGKKYETNCTNGIDDDGNGQTDCADPICAVTPTCGGGNEICDNGIDDDADGFIDCVDGRCVLNSRCTQFDVRGGTTPGQLCNTFLSTPCNSGRTAQVTYNCVPQDQSCY